MLGGQFHTGWIQLQYNMPGGQFHTGWIQLQYNMPGGQFHTGCAPWMQQQHARRPMPHQLHTHIKVKDKNPMIFCKSSATNTICVTHARRPIPHRLRTMDAATKCQEAKATAHPSCSDSVRTPHHVSDSPAKLSRVSLRSKQPPRNPAVAAIPTDI